MERRAPSPVLPLLIPLQLTHASPFLIYNPQFPTKESAP
jgi:hypothetical protein